MSKKVAKVQDVRLVEVHGQRLTTNSLIVSENCKVTHNATIKLVRRFIDDLQEVGRVGFEIRSFETKGGIQEQEIAILDDYAAMLLLTHMRSNEPVSKFKKALVQEFKRLHKIITEPNRKQEIQHKRDTSKPMTDMLIFVRETVGKLAPNVNHYGNEHKFCNRALTGKWKKIDESELDVYDTKLLAAIRGRNTLLMTRYPELKDREKPLDSFVAEYREKYPRLTLVSGAAQ